MRAGGDSGRLQAGAVAGTPRRAVPANTTPSRGTSSPGLTTMSRPVATVLTATCCWLGQSTAPSAVVSTVRIVFGRESTRLERLLLALSTNPPSRTCATWKSEKRSAPSRGKPRTKDPAPARAMSACVSTSACRACMTGADVESVAYVRWGHHRPVAWSWMDDHRLLKDTGSGERTREHLIESVRKRWSC